MKKDGVHIELLLNYLENKLDKKARAEIEQKLAADAGLRQICSVLRQLLEDSEAVGGGESGEAVRKISDSIFDDFQKSKNNRGILRGVKLFDSQVLPLPEGVRPAVVETRRVKYRMEEYGLELSFYPVTSDAYEIIGQMTGPVADEPVRVVLKGKGCEFTADSDRFLVFRFPRVPVMKCRLYLLVKGRKLAAVDIEL